MPDLLFSDLRFERLERELLVGTLSPEEMNKLVESLKAKLDSLDRKDPFYLQME